MLALILLSSRSEVFAFLTPISTNAVFCLNIRHNTFLAAEHVIDEHLTSKLDFHSISSRPSSSFRSLRHDSIMLCSGDIDGIEPHHFVVHFEI
jgi:hypothetical protein